MLMAALGIAIFYAGYSMGTLEVPGTSKLASEQKPAKVSPPDAQTTLIYPDKTKDTTASESQPDLAAPKLRTQQSRPSLVGSEKKAALTAPADSLPSGTPPNKIETVYVTATRVNVRHGPGTNFPVQTSLPRGTKVSRIGRRDQWTVVRLSPDDKTEYWISSQFLSPDKPKVTKPTPASVRQRAVAPPSRAEVSRARKALILQSIAAYPGSCPCPYNVDRGGRRCGGRSAWSRRGGYAPLCYDSDVSQARLNSYFARQRGATR